MTLKLVFGKGMPRTLPGLNNFYLAGQRVEPGGGVPTAAISARNAVRTVCGKAGRRFVTTVA